MDGVVTLVILILSILLIMSTLALVYYWTDFYLRRGVQVIQEVWYIRFQKAFPIADTWLATCALLGAIGLLTEQTYGTLFSMLAASSMIFLALMDITFNVENKLYRLVGASREMKLELVGNTWILSVGVVLIVCLWTRIT